MHSRFTRVALGSVAPVMALLAVSCGAAGVSNSRDDLVASEIEDQPAGDVDETNEDGPSLDAASETASGNDNAGDGAETSAEVVEPGPIRPVPGVTVNPGRPEPGTPVEISAEVSSASATLSYRVGFDEPVSVDMSPAGDIASATIPGQDAGVLVRYRIDTDEASYPAADDTIEFFGYVITDPSITPPIPRIDWFMEPSSFEDMLTNHLLDNQLFPTTIAYDGAVYDNVMVRPRGGEYRRTNFPKQSFEFEFPKGHDFIAPDLVPYPVDQFAMGSQFGDWTMGREQASWSIFNEATGRPVHSTQTYLAQNGDFYGVYRFSEKLDAEWREAVGLDGGEFYKANGVGGWRGSGGWDLKRPKDGTSEEIDAVGARLRNDPAGPAKTTFLYENFDIPNVINYMALTALIQHDDQTFQNFFVFHDTDGSGLYSLHPWDLDETFGPATLCWDQPMTELSCMQDPLFDSMMAVPEFETMYWQRLRTLVDTQLEPTLVEDRHAALIAEVGTELADQEALHWGRNPAYAMTDVFNEGVEKRRWAFDNEPRLLPAQPDQPRGLEIVVDGTLSAQADSAAEVFELRNGSGSPVDLSGWTIDGVDLIIPAGTVIPAGDSVVVTDSIARTRSTMANKNTIVIEYGGGLQNAAAPLSLVNANGEAVDLATKP
ncbi:MAG: CotH kinase family protein [Acidimicrobiales bacterium]